MELAEASPKKAPRLPLDLTIAGILFLVAVLVGVLYFSSIPTPVRSGKFYQKYFGAAVAMACGRGFADPATEGAPALLDFLETRVDSFSCEQMPPDLATREPSGFQYSTRYMQYATALVWAVSGISWSGLIPLFVLLFATNSALVYGVFRLGMGRVLAVIFTLLLTLAGLQLFWLPGLRDYSKAPFIMALLLIMGLLVTRPVKPKRLLGLSAAGGIVLGLGFGFRSDVLICIMPFAATLLLFTPGSLVRDTKLKLLALVAFLAAFVITAWPILSKPGSNDALAHVALLGWTSHFDQPLGVVTPFYEWGHNLRDDFVGYTVADYAYRIHGEPGLLCCHSEEYGQASTQYYLEIIKAFPADLLVRVYGSVLRILELPFSYRTLDSPSWSSLEGISGYQPWWGEAFYHWRGQALRLLEGCGLFLAGATLLLTSARNLRRFIFLLLVLLYFAGYPAIEFEERQYFYLEFMGLWAWGFVLQQVIQFASLLAHREGRKTLTAVFAQPRRWWPSYGMRAVGAGLGCVVVLAVPLLVLRQYQSAHLGQLFDAYLGAEKEPLATTQTPSDNDRIMISSPQLGPPSRLSSEAGSPRVYAEYLVAEFSSEQCGRPVVTIVTRYRYPPKADMRRSLGTMFSRAIRVELPQFGGKTQLFFPAYYATGEGFQGMEMFRPEVRCLVRLYRIKDTRQFPLLLTVKFLPNWRHLPRYQVLAGLPFPQGVDMNRPWYGLFGQPRFTLNQGVGEWTLLGYNVDENRLAAGDAVDLYLYWLAPPDVDPITGDDLYRDVSGHWVQGVRGVRNLIPDGGFEKGNLDVNFPGDIYKAAPETRDVAADFRGGQPTMVGILRNTETYTRSSLVASVTGVDPEHIYLQAGWLRGEKGSGYLGRRWLPGGKTSYMVSKASPTAWAHYIQLVRPPTGTADAQIWLLNFGSEGRVYFDDIVFADLGRLNADSCEPAESGGQRRCGTPLVHQASSPSPAR